MELGGKKFNTTTLIVAFIILAGGIAAFVWYYKKTMPPIATGATAKNPIANVAGDTGGKLKPCPCGMK